MRKPNLFIVGAPKCGTTSLYYYLDGHPQVFLSSPKEINFFSKSEIESQNLYYNDYKPLDEEEYISIFSTAGKEKKVIGEASVSYLFYPEVAGRIYKFNPRAKIIVLIRDPVKRAWSHYLMDKRLGLVKKDFMEIFRGQGNVDELHFQQYFLLGNYFTQIKRYFDLFGMGQVKVIFSSDLKSRTEEVADELYDFLGIAHRGILADGEFNTYKEPKNLVLKKMYANDKLRNIAKEVLPEFLQKLVHRLAFSTRPPDLNNADDRTVRDYYLDEIIRLEQLLKTDLSKWK